MRGKHTCQNFDQIASQRGSGHFLFLGEGIWLIEGSQPVS